MHLGVDAPPPTMPTTTTPQSSSNTPLPHTPNHRNISGPRTKNGSYRQYYQRRHHAIHGDHRLALLRDVCKRHATSFTILDIGCNDGTITTELASLDTCSRAVGIDINPNLIGHARSKLRAIVQNRHKPVHALQGPLPRYCETLPLNVRQAVQLGREPRNRNGIKDNCMFAQANRDTTFPGNLTFRTEDFAQPQSTRTSREVAQYDIVLCLSVTKWVHFAWGDTGLTRMFRRIYECLKPEGILVLEPQPMKSYKSAIRKGLGKKDLTGERRIKPHQFAAYLKSSIGFWEMKMLRDVRERGHAFNRPIMAFLKGSHLSWRHVFASSLPYAAYMEHHYDGAPEPVPIVHNHNMPLLAAQVISPETVPPTDPPPPNPASVNAAPKNAPLENATSTSAATSAQVPTTEGQAANAEEKDGQNEQSENDEGNKCRQAERPAVVQQEESIQASPQQVNPEASASHSTETDQRQVNEPVREANTSALNDEDNVPRTSACKRTRSHDGTENTDETRSKAPKPDTDEATQ